MDKFNSTLEFFRHLGLEFGTYIAGAAGSYVMTRRDKTKTFVEKLGAIAAGGLIANYMSPIVANIINFPEGMQYPVGFIVGTMGVDAIKYVWDFIKTKIKTS
jgi:hypothetical protein